MTSLNDQVGQLMREIRTDKAIFENFEIDSRYADKYGAIDGNTKVFDYWYNRFSEIKDRVEEYDRLVESIRTEIQKQFQSCHTCGLRLSDTFRKYPNYVLSQARANIDPVGGKALVMVLFKTKADVEPETLADYAEFLHSIYEVEQTCNKDFSPQTFSVRTLLLDDEISIDCIVRDFPISIRFQP